MQIELDDDFVIAVGIVAFVIVVTAAIIFVESKPSPVFDDPVAQRIMAVKECSLFSGDRAEVIKEIIRGSTNTPEQILMELEE